MLFHQVSLAEIGSHFLLPKSKILITGGLGFIFSYVAEWFAARGHDVHICDACRDGSHPELMGNFTNLGCTIWQNDVNDIHCELVGDYQFDYIIHAAAESNVDKSIDNSEIFFNTNIRSTAELLDWVRHSQRNLKQFLYISTDEVYGSSTQYPTPENKLNPSSPYAASKAAAGCICNCYRVTFGLPIREFRMCNIIGKRQADTKLVPRAIRRLLTDEPFPLYDNGYQTREYLDVRLIGLYIEHFFSICSTGLDSRMTELIVHNITTNTQRSTLQVINAIEKLAGKTMRIENSSRLGHDAHYTMQRTKWLDVMPVISFEETMKWILTGGEE